MSYSIKIVDNDNGKVLTEETEVKAIVGSVTTEVGSYSISYTACNPFELITALASATEAVKKTRDDTPIIKVLESYISGLTDSDE